jgi:hypothetical protein
MNALSGDLSVFSPADVLQFLGYVRADGVVELQGTAGSARVYLEDGRISAVSTDVDRPRLGAILGRRGQVGEAELEQALQRAVPRGRLLGETLVESGTLSPEDLAGALEDQLLQVLSRVLAWECGSFQFQAGVCAEIPRLPARPPLDRLLFEGLRRLDEETETLGRLAR